MSLVNKSRINAFTVSIEAKKVQQGSLLDRARQLRSLLKTSAVKTLFHLVSLLSKNGGVLLEQDIRGIIDISNSKLNPSSYM